MSVTWKQLSARDRSLIEHAAGALLLLDDVAPSAADTDRAADRTVTFHDLRTWLQEAGSATIPVRLRLALASDPRLRRDLDRLLLRRAMWHVPRASAASSGALDRRHGAGFHIRLQLSRAAANQVYVLITLTGERDREPTTLVVRSAAGDYVKWTLPEAQAGVIQILIDDAADGLRLLRDPKSELYLW